jgi:hypothetical protein
LTVFLRTIRSSLYTTSSSALLLVPHAHPGRIAVAPGVNEESLLEGNGPPAVRLPVVGARPYTVEDFARHQKTQARSVEIWAREDLGNCEETLGLIFEAALAGLGVLRRRERVLGVLQSFKEWGDGVRRDFELGEEIDKELDRRRGKMDVGLTYGQWRQMARRDPRYARALGFKDDPEKGEEELLRLEVAVRPGWAPGRRMKLPDAWITEWVEPRGSRG